MPELLRRLAHREVKKPAGYVQGLSVVEGAWRACLRPPFVMVMSGRDGCYDSFIYTAPALKIWARNVRRYFSSLDFLELLFE